jgi:hypothetical protein
MNTVTKLLKSYCESESCDGGHSTMNICVIALKLHVPAGCLAYP